MVEENVTRVDLPSVASSWRDLLYS